MTAVTCTRCGAPCTFVGPGSADARVLRRSNVPEGLCASCAATQFLQTMEPLRTIIERKGTDVLLDPRAQESFAQVLTAGHSDAEPGELSWERIHKNWSLPFPRKRRKARSF